MGSNLLNNYLAFLSLTLKVRNLEFGIMYLKISEFYPTQNNLIIKRNNQHTSPDNIRR